MKHSFKTVYLCEIFNAMVIEFDPERSNPHKLKEVVDSLRNGGVIIYPTDTVYAMGCDLHNNKAIEKICRIKGVKSNKTQFSFICNDLSHISHYARQLDNNVFKLMKRALPGPYTFIVDASNNVPKLIQEKKKTVGIRVPNHTVPQLLVQELGRPIITTSLKSDDEISVYMTDPLEIANQYLNQVDYIINSGYGYNDGSTVINCSNGQIEVIREGMGSLDIL